MSRPPSGRSPADMLRRVPLRRSFGVRLLLATFGAILFGTVCSLTILVVGERHVADRATGAVEQRIGEVFRDHMRQQAESDVHNVAGIRQAAEEELRSLAAIVQLTIDQNDRLAPLLAAAEVSPATASRLATGIGGPCSQNSPDSATVVTVSGAGHEPDGQLTAEAQQLIRATSLLGLAMPSVRREGGNTARVYFVGTGRANFIRMAPWRDLAHDGLPWQPNWTGQDCWQGLSGLVEAWEAWLRVHPAHPAPLTALPPRSEPGEGGLTQSLGVPIWDAARTRCLGGMWCDVPFARAMQRLDLVIDQQSLVFLADSDGAVLAVRNSHRCPGVTLNRVLFDPTHSSSLRPAPRDEERGTIQLPRPVGHQALITSFTVAGKPFLAALHNLPPILCWHPGETALAEHSWTMGLALPQSKVTTSAYVARTSVQSSARPLLVGQIGVLLATAAILSCAVWFALRRMYGRMTGMAEAIGAIATGTGDVRVPEHPLDELGLIACDINAMADRLQELIRNSERRNDEFLAMLRSLPHVVRVWDPRHREMLFANEAAKDVLDVPEAQAGRSRAQARSDGADGALGWEFQHPGTARSYVVVEQSFVWPDGRQVLLQAATDITRQRRSELALRELNAQLEERVRERTKELREHVDEATRMNRAMVNLLEDLQKANLELAATGRELGAANHELEAFSYSVSHDLRAPLRSIGGFAEILLEEHADQLTKEGRAHLMRIYDSTKKMGSLIDSLLTLSRIGRRGMHIADIDVSGLAWDVIDDLVRPEPSRRDWFHVQDGIRARADLHLLRVVLVNLLDNAMKFSSRRQDPCIEMGTVRVPVADKSGAEEEACYVRDNGAGFDMQFYGKLFHPFSRLHKATQFAGIGIGLTTVQRIVVRHGGRVWAESKPDLGATFFFTVPTRPPTSPAESDASAVAGAHAPPSANPGESNHERK